MLSRHLLAQYIEGTTFIFFKSITVCLRADNPMWHFTTSTRRRVRLLIGVPKSLFLGWEWLIFPSSVGIGGTPFEVCPSEGNAVGIANIGVCRLSPKGEWGISAQRRQLRVPSQGRQ